MIRVRVFSPSKRLMNHLTARQLLDPTPPIGRAESLAGYAPRSDQVTAPKGNRVAGGLVAAAIQALFVAGIAYGTMQTPPAQKENLTVVSVLEETPVLDEPPPLAAPQLAAVPVLTMQLPEVTITPQEPPKTAPTAIVSDAPAPPPPPRIDDGERMRQVSDFQHALQRHLLRELMYPAQARARREEGIVYVRVAMNRAGRVLSATLQNPSDHAQLNAEALAVIQRAQPLPLPPPAVAGDPVDLIVPVTFNLRGGRRGR